MIDFPHAFSTFIGALAGSAVVLFATWWQIEHSKREKLQIDLDCIDFALPSGNRHLMITLRNVGTTDILVRKLTLQERKLNGHSYDIKNTKNREEAKKLSNSKNNKTLPIIVKAHTTETLYEENTFSEYGFKAKVLSSTGNEYKGCIDSDCQPIHLTLSPQ